MSLEYITRPELKTEIREIHADLRTIVNDFGAEIKNLQAIMSEIWEKIDLLSNTIDEIANRMNLDENS